MVDLVRIESKIKEFEDFFNEVITISENIDISSSGSGAQYGLDCLVKMKKSFNAYKKKPLNKSLKSIYYGFTAINRGVEGFNNFDLEKKFREVSKDVYSIQEELQQYISW